MSFDSKTVYAATTTPLYPDGAPFHPGQSYPEYSLGTTGPENRVYEAVRNLFLHAGLDAAHQGTRDWNPLRDIIHPGNTVLLKPNLVKELHPRDPEGWKYLSRTAR